MGKCKKCGTTIDPYDFLGEPKLYCGNCEDILIEESNKRKEWDYYHPGEPMPASEK